MKRQTTLRRTLLVAVVALLAVTAGCTAPRADASPDTSGEITFSDRTAESGLKYSDTEGSGIGNGNAGVYIADVDNDGWEDVLAVGGERPQLFHNHNGTFVSREALPPLNRSFKSAAFVDYDRDGWTDLLLLPKGGRIVTLHNDGGTFERVNVGLGNTTYPLGAAPADYDDDGDVDLFVYQSGDWADGKPEGYFSLNETFAADNGNPNLLYEQTDSGFERVTDTGISGDRWSLAASFVDLTGDDRPDIHVANDYNTDVVYVNDGDGTFTQRQLGGNTARNGMTSELADVNGDGRLDVFVTNIYLPVNRETMSAERYERVKDFLTFVINSNRTRGNTLLINQGDGSFTDRAVEWNVRDGGWGWAATFADFDNDGDRDLLHTTQNVVRIDPDDPFYTYPMLWERESDTFTQLNASDRGFEPDNARGVATLDYDRDGDVDVVSATYSGEFQVYENDADASTRSLQLRVVDEDEATAMGATVTVRTNHKQVVRRQHPNTGYLSQESRVLHVGTPESDAVDLLVVWPDGTERTYEDVATGQRVVVTPTGVTRVTTFEASAQSIDGTVTDEREPAAQ